MGCFSACFKQVSVSVKGKAFQGKRRRETGDCACLSLFVCVCLFSVEWSLDTVAFSNVFFTRMTHASPYLLPILFSPPPLPHCLVIWIHTGESLALHCLTTPAVTDTIYRPQVFLIFQSYCSQSNCSWFVFLIFFLLSLIGMVGDVMSWPSWL